MNEGTVAMNEKYWQIRGGRVFTEIGVPDSLEYRTRILRLEQGYSLSETYLQSFATALRTL